MSGQINGRITGSKCQSRSEDVQDRLATSKGESVGTLMSVARLVLRCNFFVPLFVRIQCKYSVMRLEVLSHDTVQSCEN